MIKRFASIALLLLLLTSCSQKIQKQDLNIIKPAHLTKKEVSLLDAVGVEQPFIFDIVLNQKNSHLEYWVEYYERGIKQEASSRGSSTIVWKDNEKKKEYKIIFYKEPLSEKNKKTEKFFISLIDNDGYTKMDFELPVPNKNTGSLTETLQERTHLKDGKTLTVGIIIESKNGKIITPDISWYSSKEEINNVAKKYDRVYFFNVKLNSTH
ncbi:hypothetical protein J6TS2_04210 [Heyndrickxia sporothermodurans]|nr:hypothetical protein J6TS2_04210 [Heyndrickxia sporothermodurans]